jgi:hypothetical protein
VQKDFNGSFTELIKAADASAERLMQLLIRMPYFYDVELYEKMEVPFYKRAQLTAADLSLAFAGQGLGRFYDLKNLTIFADNLVPHVLRVDSILLYEAELGSHIDAGKRVPAGATEEIEIRACALYAVELLKKARLRAGHRVTSSRASCDIHGARFSALESRPAASLQIHPTPPQPNGFLLKALR